MYIVTFYSYKGGVGRTMALVNAAVELAHRGHRVLVVDFDLEAPGLTTYSLFSDAAGKRGVVDYVVEYLNTNEAPKASDFIHQCNFGETAIYVMPAGKKDRDYSAHLHSIDWNDLYTFRRGYLLFEDLKQQLSGSELNFDYVLIDSRTGHTDVGGICTRQMPDAVVMMFFPNEQNLSGLETVASEIQEESKISGRPKISVHYCASNVPDLDDEDLILATKLEEAKRRLNFTEEPLVIHHYNSLPLLNQSIFVTARPRSKLALEYKELVRILASRNLEDRSGALSALRQILADLRSETIPSAPTDSTLMETLRRIKGLHPDDGEVAWRMSHVLNFLGDLEGEADALSKAIDQNVRPRQALRRRAYNARARGDMELAIRDLRAILAAEDADEVELVSAIEMLRDLDNDWIAPIENSPSVRRLPAGEKALLVQSLLGDARGLQMAVSFCREIMNEPDTDVEAHHTAKINLVLALISLGEFNAALSELGKDRIEALGSDDAPLIFNYAVAEWGAKSRPPEDLMARLVQIAEETSKVYTDPNWFQCLSLAYHVCGRREFALQTLERSRAALARIGGRNFSCWRYLQVSRVTMRNDLDAMESFYKGSGDEPPVLRGALMAAETVH